jgi:hypothetical protein
MSSANRKKEKMMSSGKATGSAVDPNVIIVQLEPQKKAQLEVLAKEKRLSAEELVLQIIDKILAETPVATSPKQPTRSLRGLLAKYGPAPSAEEIDQNRAEMFANFPRSEFE